MPDREKVIKGLKCRARLGQDGSCNGCKYFHPYSYDPDTGWCDSAELWNDALSLLREQTPKLTYCPNCGAAVEVKP